jgi:hypothetical protein
MLALAPNQPLMRRFSEKETKTVTLIVGIICKDAIVLAAESETTAGNIKKHGTKKISVVEFLNGWALVGESGVAEYSNDAICRLKKVAAKTEITHDRTIADTVGNVVKEIRSRIISLHPQATPDEWQYFFCQTHNAFELTVGYYFENEPLLFRVPLHSATPAPETARPFSVSGVGGDLAFYLLKQSPLNAVPSHQAALIAAYVTHEVKNTISGCGGGTSLAVVSNGKRPEIISEPAVAKMGSEITRLVEMGNAQRLQSISEILKSTPMVYQSLDVVPGATLCDGV